ncbi:hypothetical protein Tco_1235634 [Tanacetum coccineum]
MMMASKSYEKNPAHKALYDALIQSLFMDEDDMDKAIVAMDQFAQLKRKHDDQDEDLNAGSNQGKDKKRPRKDTQPSKKSSASKESSKGNTPAKTSKTGKSVTTEEPDEEHVHDMSLDVEENIIDEMGNADEQPDGEHVPNTNNDLNNNWFKQPPRPPTPDPEWNKCQVVDDQLEQTWFNNLVSAQKDPLTFDELTAIPIDFSKFAQNQLKLENITKANLVRPVYNLLKGTCQSSIELEYNMEECYKALTNKLNWENPEGDGCPFDLNKPLPLKGHPGHLTVAIKYFFNNDLEYLKSKDSKRKYTTSITKMKGACVKVNKLHGYGYLEEIMVRRADRQMYKFKEGDFINLYLNDIEDMLLLVVQHKLFHLVGDVIVDLVVALRMFIRSLIIKKRVEDVQLGVESYQNKLNITRPQKDFPTISTKEPYTPLFNLQRVVYEDLSNRKRLMRANELYKFSDGTLKSVCDTLYHRLLNLQLGYNRDMPRRKWSAMDQICSGIIVDLIDKQLLERQIIRNLEIFVGAREFKMEYRRM